MASRVTTRQQAAKNAKQPEPIELSEESVSEDDSDPLTSDEEDPSWISWFCSLKGNEFFAEVDEEYIGVRRSLQSQLSVQDDFNLTGLSSQVPNYDYALEMIQDGDLDDLTEEQIQLVESAAEHLYGLIHARYIITSRGLAQMLEKYNAVEFGRCPRVYCQGQPVLPCGQSDIPRTNTVKLFCPKCQDLYYPKFSKHANLDSAYWGTTFPHMLLQTYPELVPVKPAYSYVPRIFGFKIHKSSTNYPRTAREKAATNSTTNATSTTAKK